MGMFDWVHFAAPCVSCGAWLSRFQSKDGPYSVLVLDPYDVRMFYDYCVHCKTFNGYRVETALSQVDRVGLRLLGKPTDYRATYDPTVETEVLGETTRPVKLSG